MKVVLQNLTKIFPSRDKKAGKEVVAVNDFTFEIPDGKLIGLLGPSGCGKSTTLYMISGLQKPTSGKIFFGEDDVTELSTENRGIGLVFQNYALYPHMTVKQNILFPLQNLKGADKMTKEAMDERAHWAASLVQIGKPQDVYDDPTNLFVAKFLGTPPINVLSGKVAGGKVYIGEDAVLEVSGVEDQEVIIGIRPEGFELDDNGPLHCQLNNVEVMGRDVSIVCTNPASQNPVIRAIINADNKVDTSVQTVRYSIKPHKFFLFNKETEERIRYEVK